MAFDMSLVSVVIYDSKLFDRGHMIRRWAEGVERAFTANAISQAPVNKRANKSSWYAGWPVGALKASIHGDVERIGPAHLQTLINVGAPYAKYVVAGTGTILAHSKRGMRLPGNLPYSRSASWKHSVRGQSANDFLGRAHDMTAVTHPSLRGHGQSLFQQW